MNEIKSRLEINPIVVKELRSRMRGGRAFLTLTILLLVTGGTMIGMIGLMTNVSNMRSTVLSFQVGGILFSILVMLELLMVSIITPAVTAGSISGEVEKLTFDLLLATPLSPSQILWGKLISALSYILLLLFAAIPLASIVFVFGGISLTSMFKALLVLSVTAVMAGSMGLFFSAWFQRTGRATIVSLLVMIVMLLVPVFISVILLVINQQDMPRWFLAISPISAAASSILTPGGQQSGVNPLSFIFLGGMLDQSLVPISFDSIPRPIYHYSLVLFSVLTIVFYMGAVSLVNPGHRWRLSLKQILTALALLVLLAGLVTAGFFATAGHYEWYNSSSTDTSDINSDITSTPVAPIETERVIVPENVQATPTPLPVNPE